MEWFKIDWKGYYSIDTAPDKPEAKDIGVYAIYEMKGREPEKLLYVGETYTQTFSTRLKQHRKDWIPRYEGTKMAVCFGKIAFPAGKKISRQIVLDIERLLIHKLIPPINTSGKKGYKGREIFVFNIGKNGNGKIHSLITDDKEFLPLLRKYLT